MLTRIGPYDIQRELGRGGMGVVYLARDGRLDRDVAIKALPPDLAADPGRLERFQREARTLAALSHPNVAGILGVEEAESARYLVLEYIDGQSLADRLDAGPLDPDEAIAVGIQVAAGLAAAHEAGIVHRDLKPANIMLAADGTAKLLDFGLARTDDAGTSAASGPPGDDLATLTSPVIQHSPTMPGVILGTAAYMSPEQARGRRVDRRSDVWSFGVVLYEMLTGGSPFSGETVSDSIGAILHKDVDLERLPPHAAAGLRRLIARCTQRDPQLRYQDLRDVRLDLMELERDPDAFGGAAGAAATPSTTRPQPPVRVASAAIILAVGVAAGWGLSRTLTPPTATDSAATTTTAATADLAAEPLTVDLSLSNILPPDPPQMIAMSPAERRVAWISTTEPGVPNAIHMVSVRDLRTGATTVLEGTEGATSVTFSPDGRQIAFGVRDSQGASIRRIPAAGGPVLTVLSASESQEVNDSSISWMPDGRLLLSDMRTRDWFTVDVNSGERRDLGRVTGLEDAALFGGALRFGDGLFFLTGFAPARSGTGLNGYVVDLETMTATLLVANGANPHLAGPDRVVFARGSTICVAPFDPATRSIDGPVTPVVTGLYREMAFSLTERGDLVLVRSEEGQIGSIRIVGGGRDEDEDGGPEIFSGSSTEHTGDIARFPDGTRLLSNITRPEAAIDMPFAAIFDLRTRRTTRVEVGPGERGRAVIGLPGYGVVNDGRVIVGRLYSPAECELVIVDPDGRRPAETVLPGLVEPGGQSSASATPDGRYVLFDYSSADGQDPDGIYMVDLEVDALERRPIPVMASDRWDARSAALSPDGRWLAFRTNAAGVPEVVVRSFDPLRPEGTGGGIPVASGRSMSPTWSVDGSQLYFLNEDADIVGVTFTPGETPAVGPPVVMVPNEMSRIQPFSWIGRLFVELPAAENEGESPRFAYHWDETQADASSLRGDLRVNWVRSLDSLLGE